MQKHTNSMQKHTNSMHKHTNSMQKHTNSMQKHTNSMKKHTNSMQKHTNSICIPRWIHRRVPNLVPIGPDVWQLSQTCICDPIKKTEMPPGVCRGELYLAMSIPRRSRRRVPFPNESVHLYQIWCQSVQPFDSFPTLLNAWPHNPPPPPNAPGVLRGELYLAMYIPRRIRRLVPNLVPIGRAVWQIPHTFECVTP